MARGHGTRQRYADQLRTVQVGKLAGAGLLTVGDIFYVKDADDGDIHLFKDVVPKTQRFTTIATGVAALTSDRNDYLLIAAKDRSAGVEVPWEPGADVNLAASRSHIIGLGGYGSMPEIRFDEDASLVVGYGNTVTNQLYGIELANLLITGDGAVVQTLIDIGLAANGYVYRTWMHDMIVGFVGGTLTAADCELLDHGDGLLCERCEIGSRTQSEHPNDNYLQAAPTAPASESHNPTFIDCLFTHFAAAAGDQFCTILATSIPALFKRCSFMNLNVSATTMTEGMTVAAAAEVLLDQCSFVGADIAATTANSWITPAGQGNGVLAADIYNPGLAIDGAEPVGVDT